jgi:hypothetical protein
MAAARSRERDDNDDPRWCLSGGRADTALKVEMSADAGALVVRLDDPQRLPGIYPVRVRLLDTAGNHTEWTWPLQIRGKP